MVDEKRYRTEIPNIIDDLGLDPYERTLYVHYKRVCGASGGQCTEGVRGTAEKTKMSFAKVSSTRQALIDRGLILMQPHGEVGGFAVTIVDIWHLNTAYYADKNRPGIDGWTIKQLEEWVSRCSGGEHPIEEVSPQTPNLNGHSSLSEQGCSGDEQGCSPGEQKKEHINPTTTTPTGTHVHAKDEQPPEDGIGVLLKQFLISSQLRMPRKQEKLEQWRADLGEILKLAGSNLESAKRLIEDTIKALGNKYTIVGPQSIYDSCAAEWAKVRRQEPLRPVINGHHSPAGPARASPAKPAYSSPEDEIAAFKARQKG